MKFTPAPEGVDWGTTNIPEDKRLKVGRKYFTRNGRVAEVTKIKLYNSAGREVTNSVEGYIHKVMPSGRVRRIWSTWALSGRAVFVGDHPDDIVCEAKKFGID